MILYIIYIYIYNYIYIYGSRTGISHITGIFVVLPAPPAPPAPAAPPGAPNSRELPWPVTVEVKAPKESESCQLELDSSGKP